MADVPAHNQISPVDDADWPQQVAGMIVDGVGVVRDKTTVPVQKVARYAVYGFVAGLLAMVSLLLLLIAGLRATTEFLQWATGEQDIVWLTYTIIGAIFVAFGLYCWKKRTPS